MRFATLQRLKLCRANNSAAAHKYLMKTTHTLTGYGQLLSSRGIFDLNYHAEVSLDQLATYVQMGACPAIELAEWHLSNGTPLVDTLLIYDLKKGTATIHEHTPPTLQYGDQPAVRLDQVPGIPRCLRTFKPEDTLTLLDLDNLPDVGWHLEPGCYATPSGAKSMTPGDIASRDVPRLKEIIRNYMLFDHPLVVSNYVGDSRVYFDLNGPTVRLRFGVIMPGSESEAGHRDFAVA